jgi:hypothetical protein
MKYVSAEYIRVWERIYDELADSIEWDLVDTEHHVGSRNELMYWRVIESGTSNKTFFHGPEDYFLHSGADATEHQPVIMRWREKQRLLRRLFATTP